MSHIAHELHHSSCYGIDFRVTMNKLGCRIVIQKDESNRAIVHDGRRSCLVAIHMAGSGTWIDLGSANRSGNLVLPLTCVRVVALVVFKVVDSAPYGGITVHHLLHERTRNRCSRFDVNIAILWRLHLILVVQERFNLFLGKKVFDSADLGRRSHPKEVERCEKLGSDLHDLDSTWRNPEL